MTITVTILEADAATVVGTVDMTHVVDGAIDDPIDGDGQGELVVGLESPDRDDLAVRGRVLRWNGTGSEPFHSLVEANTQVSVADSHSKVPRQITVRGRSLIGQWDDPRVKQWPGMRHNEVRYYTRHFNYASPGKASLINGTVYQHQKVLDFDSNGQYNTANNPWLPPSTWRDPDAYRIWSQPHSTDQEQGVVLFRKRFTMTGGILRQHATCDDRFLAWIGGVPIFKCPDYPDVGWVETFPASTFLPNGTYDCVVKAENGYSTVGQYAWLGFAAWRLTSPIEGLSSSTKLFQSDSSWKSLECIETPEPGWTVPEILTVFLDEFQDDGALTNWEVVDMTPGDWDELPETNFEVGKTTGLGVIRQLADGQAEFGCRVQAGVKQLLCYAPGALGNFDAPPDPIPELGAADLASLSFDWIQP